MAANLNNTKHTILIWAILFMELSAGFKPVSYTHLDVYKRQV